jgi:hypothetical protein
VWEGYPLLRSQNRIARTMAQTMPQTATDLLYVSTVSSRWDVEPTSFNTDAAGPTYFS